MIMGISTKQNLQAFKGNPLVSTAAFLDSRVLMNKAALDVACDVPIVLNANNKVERRERFNRAIIPWLIAYASPFITLPLTNRLAMKHIAKLSSFNGKEANLIKISNKFLTSNELLKNGVKEISQKFDINLSEVLKKCNGDYEVLRKKLTSAKTAVSSFDFLFTTFMAGSIGFLNNAQTKKKTGQKGFSAEFEMADKQTVEARTEGFNKTSDKFKKAYIGTLAGLTLLPLALRKGMLANNPTKLNSLIKKHADKFDYKDGIFMSRFPFFLMAVGSYLGIFGASRNETEIKDNAIRSVFSLTAFFGGDLLIGSTLARLSDKFLKTDLLEKNAPKTLLNKIVPPTKKLENLTGRSKNIGAALFWINLASLAGFMGWALPLTLNKMIKKDVDNYVKNNTTSQSNNNYSMEAFIEKIANK